MTMLSILFSRQFLPLFLSQFLISFNDNVFKNAMIILLTYELYGNDPGQAQWIVTIAAGLFVLPYFLFSASAGQFADKYRKAILIRWIKGLEVLLMGFALAALYWMSLPLLLSTLFFLGTHATYFGPLKYSILPEQLPASSLLIANGVIEAGTFLSILIGTMLGGLLILAPHGKEIISILLFISSLLGWLSSFYIIPHPPANGHLVVQRNFFKAIWFVLIFCWPNPPIFRTLIAISWFWFVGGIFLAEIPVLTKLSLHANEAVVTYFLTLFSIGLGVGSVLCNRLLQNQISLKWVLPSALLISLFTFDLYWCVVHAEVNTILPLMNLSEFFSMENGLRISLDMIFLAVFGGVYSVPLYVYLQLNSKREVLAQVISSNNIMNGLFMVGSSLMAMGILHLSFTVNEIFLVTAILNLGVGFWFYFKMRS